MDRAGYSDRVIVSIQRPRARGNHRAHTVGILIRPITPVCDSNLTATNHQGLAKPGLGQPLADIGEPYGASGTASAIGGMQARTKPHEVFMPVIDDLTLWGVQISKPPIEALPSVLRIPTKQDPWGRFYSKYGTRDAVPVTCLQWKSTKRGARFGRMPCGNVSMESWFRRGLSCGWRSSKNSRVTRRCLNGVIDNVAALQSLLSEHLPNFRHPRYGL